MQQISIFSLLKITEPKKYLVAFIWTKTKLGFPEFRGSLIECRKYLKTNFRQTKSNHLTIIKDYYE